MKHYIALDWAQRNMAIARITDNAKELSVMDVASSVKEFQLYLKRLKGEKVLTFEETTTSQWLYTELKPYADEIVVCDPYRNRLLSDGPKTDKMDAIKLVQLLKAGLLKPVYHSGDEFYRLRMIVSGYSDWVESGVRLQNQRSALFRAQGLQRKKDAILPGAMEQFVLDGLEKGICVYEEQKSRYEKEFARMSKKHAMLRNLRSIPGIGLIGAVKIAAMVVDAKRFKDRGHFLSYCGLIRLEKTSGGRSYGSRKPRYSRMLKSVFKTAALACMMGTTPMSEYYQYLINKGYAPFHARHALSRRIATVAWAIMKHGKKFSRGEGCNRTQPL